MKKISNKQVQTALLRGAVAITGVVTTAVIAVFFDSLYGVLATVLVGAGIITLIVNVIK